jgi:methylmalonyl-CoA/ethylmalonyl-CoA epimerase
MTQTTLEFWHHHAGISVPDLDASIAWYRDVLGFQLVRRYVIETIPAEVAVVKNGPLHMEIFQVPGAQAASADRRVPDKDLQTHGNKHVSFAVEDVHRLAEELRRRGADIVWVKDFKFGSNAFIRDNSGNLVEFVQSVRPPEGFAMLTVDSREGEGK